MSLKINEETFKYYFYFIQERMQIFWKKMYKKNTPWTNDPILQTYRFTNVYRSTDRVSQYLIKNVIYNDNNLPEEDILLRIIVFKIFNKIETWEYIEENIGLLTLNNFNIANIGSLLTKRRLNQPIFNNAYMMTGTHVLYNHLKYKHEKWLEMVQNEFVQNGTIKKILNSKSLKDLYLTLKECSFIGEFLAYQYAIDFNYSPFINFSENSFVKAGIGAIRGIKKCFTGIEKQDYETAIRFTLDNLEKLQNKYGYSNPLFFPQRKPTLIDLQNCFCETDKYLRVKLPTLIIQNKRIKQRYSPISNGYNLYFPPKWKLKLGKEYGSHRV